MIGIDTFIERREDGDLDPRELTPSERAALRQHDAESGYVPNSERNPTGVPQRAEEYSNYDLDSISWSIRDELGWGDKDIADFRRDLHRQLWSLISFADFSSHFDFIAYEEASSLCMSALSNGKRTAEQLSKAVAALNAFEREDEGDGSEIYSSKLEQLIARVDGYQSRLWYWRERYAMSRRVYREVVKTLQAQFHWLESEWKSPDEIIERSKRLKESQRQSYARWQAAERKALSRRVKK